MKNKHYPTFGAALAAYLDAAEMGVLEASALAGLGPTTARRYTKGERQAQENALTALCDALGLEAQYSPGRGWQLLKDSQPEG